MYFFGEKTATLHDGEGYEDVGMGWMAVSWIAVR